jgi:hypothetical protein
MKFEIIDDINLDNVIKINEYFTPLIYRISIKLGEDTIILKREYFYVGYLTGEQADEFYFNDSNIWDHNYLNYATFTTKNFDTEYLKEKETELINKFFEKLNYTTKKLKQDKEEKMLYFDEKIKLYKEYSNCELFLKLNRNEKLNKINEKF